MIKSLQFTVVPLVHLLERRIRVVEVSLGRVRRQTRRIRNETAPCVHFLQKHEHLLLVEGVLRPASCNPVRPVAKRALLGSGKLHFRMQRVLCQVTGKKIIGAIVRLPKEKNSASGAVHQFLYVNGTPEEILAAFTATKEVLHITTYGEKHLFYTYAIKVFFFIWLNRFAKTMQYPKMLVNHKA